MGRRYSCTRPYGVTLQITRMFLHVLGTRVFLGAFAKLRKATVSYVMSAHPSVCMEQLGSHWTDFYEI